MPGSSAAPAPVPAPVPEIDLIARDVADEIAAIPIGFGCAFLHGGKSLRQSTALVQAAFDAGIRYFDVARLYGEGAAEGVVGKTLAGVRDRVVLVSKVGILPTDRSIPRRLTERGLRTLRRVPGAGRHVPVLPPAEPSFHMFDARTMRRSVETSLAQLRTSHLDILLLHECTAADLAAHGAMDTLLALRAEGKVAKIGIATSLADTLEIVRDTPVDVVQIASSPLRPDVAALPPGAAGLVVTHSALRDVLPLAARACGDEALRADWMRALPFDPCDRAALSAMVIAHARYANPGGIFLFSSARPENIRDNVDACRTLRFDEAEVARFASHLRRLAGDAEA